MQSYNKYKKKNSTWQENMQNVEETKRDTRHHYKNQ